ncbi:MAG: hypothetical protein U0470_14670 [Anaerolineae bacterium]
MAVGVDKPTAQSDRSKNEGPALVRRAFVKARWLIRFDANAAR